MRFLPSLLIAVIVVIVLPIVSRLWRMYRELHGPVETLMPLLARQAVVDAAGHNVQLDYSTQSIQQVEKLLSAFHDTYATDPAAARLKFRAMAYGAYIGETIRRSESASANESACRWERDHKVAGPNS